jgi:UDP-N-acetylmuramate: L-alanyl-gamma-D-glutamyl-meso-diaminopimelate ligase
VQGVRDAYPDKRIVAVFEPRSNTSRRKDFEVPYSQAFVSADIAIIEHPIVRWNDTLDGMMDIHAVIEGIQHSAANKKIDAVAIEHPDEIFSKLTEIVVPGDVVVFMSNGFFYGLPQRLARWVVATR